MKIAIVGGGISGLATAFYLERELPGAEVSLYEAEPFCGGTMQTEERDGFLFEAGGNGFLSNKPDTLAFLKHSGAAPLLLRSNRKARIRFVYDGTLHRLPGSPLAFLRSGLLSWSGKLRTLGEIRVPARLDDEDESLQQFGYRRVGAEFTDTFLDAMSAGIFASSPAQLSVGAAFPLVVDLERKYGGLFRGMMRGRKKGMGPGGRLMSFVGGVGTLIDHLTAVLDTDIRSGCPVERIEAVDDGFRLTAEGRDKFFHQVVVATPAYAAAALLRGLDRELAARLERIRYSPIAVVGFGYEALDHPLEGFGLLTTTSARAPVLGILWDSSVFPNRAPAGKKSLRVMIGGQRNPDLPARSDEELIELARRGIRETMGATADPAVTFVKRWPRGIPNYAVGHLDNLKAVFKRLERWPGLWLNSNAYRGVSMNDCVHNSRRLVERMVQVVS